MDYQDQTRQLREELAQAVHDAPPWALNTGDETLDLFFEGCLSGLEGLPEGKEEDDAFLIGCAAEAVHLRSIADILWRDPGGLADALLNSYHQVLIDTREEE